MDAITLLRNDHQTVEKLFTRFEKAGERAFVEKREIVDRIIEELSVHATIEEQVFYPAVRSGVADVEAQTLEALEEHHVAKWVLSELEKMDPEDERFTAKTTVMIESVRHHVAEEQDDLFPKVRKGLSTASSMSSAPSSRAPRRTPPSGRTRGHLTRRRPTSSPVRLLPSPTSRPRRSSISPAARSNGSRVATTTSWTP